jgi:hypothetical protein
VKAIDFPLPWSSGLHFGQKLHSLIQGIRPLPPHVLAVIRATEKNADHLPASSFRASDIQILVKNSKTARLLSASVIKRHKLSSSVQIHATYTELRHLIFTVYCKYSLLMVFGVGTITCPAKLFHLYGKQMGHTENLLEDFNAALGEEFRKKT